MVSVPNLSAKGTDHTVVGEDKTERQDFVLATRGGGFLKIGPTTER